MFYAYHDIAGNYFRAEKSGELKMKKDILLSEIAKQVALCPACVIKLLNDNGIKTNPGISNYELVKRVSDAINKNMKFTKTLVSEILSNKKNASGISTVDKASLKNLTFGAGRLFGADGDMENKNLSEKDLLKKTELIRDMEGLSSGIGKYIGWGLFFAAIGGVIYYYYYKK